MTDDLVFVSYSRREFYFTESLVLHLQRQGINAWFDVQQLEPGVGWKTDIQNGLDQCKELVLVASQSSLASPYVKVEVEAAQKANKPVHIVLFEPLTLPPELNQAASLIDFTQGFDRGMPLLVATIQEQTPHHDPLPPLDANYLPAGVRPFKTMLRQRVILWWMLLIASLIVLSQPIIYVLSQEFARNPANGAVMLFFVPILTLWVLISLGANRHLVRGVSALTLRQDTPFKQWIGARNFRIAAFLYFFLLTVAYVMAFRSALFLLLLLPGIYLLVKTLRGADTKQWMDAILNPDLLRWCHLGNDVPYDWRIIVNQSVLPEDLEADVHYKIEKTSNDNGGTTIREVVTGVSVAIKGAVHTPKTYRLYESPQIKKVADDIRAILKRNAFQEVQDDTTEPDYYILLLSPWTLTATAEQLIQQHPQNTLPVLVSPTDLSALPNITTLQLVDFRRRYEPQLSSALQYLHTQNAQQRSAFSIAILPVRVSAFFALREIRVIQRSFIFMVSLSFFVGIVGFVSLPFSQPINLLWVIRLLAYIICLGLGIWLRRTAQSIAELAPQSPQTLNRLLVAPLLLFTAMAILGLQPYVVSNSYPQLGNEIPWRFFLIGFVVALSINLIYQLRQSFRTRLLTPEIQPMLGLPAKTAIESRSYVVQGLIILVVAVLAYVSVVLVTRDVRYWDVASNAVASVGTFIGGFITSIIAFAFFSGLGRPSYSKDDPVFAMSDAPALRYHLQKVLRKPSY